MITGLHPRPVHIWKKIKPDKHVIQLSSAKQNDNQMTCSSDLHFFPNVNQMGVSSGCHFFVNDNQMACSSSSHFFNFFFKLTVTLCTVTDIMAL